MKTTDLFKFNRSSKRINESIDKVFGQKLNFETFDTEKLEDARNKLRTQIHTARGESGFNETIENEALTKAQWMHDAIVAELMDRQEHIVDNTFQEESEDKETVLGKIADEEDYDALYDLMSDIDSDAGKWIQSQIEDITSETGLHPDDDFEEIENRLMDRIVSDFGEGFGQPDDEGGDTDDAYALASAGHGSDEDYGFAGHDEGIETEGESQHSDMSIAQDLYAVNPDLDDEQEILNAAFPFIVKMTGSKKSANYMLNYDEDFPGEMIGAYKWLQRQAHDVGEDVTMERDRDPEDWDEGNTEPPNNFAIYINGKKWKVLPGRGTYADDHRERAQYQQLKDMCAKKSQATGKKWQVHVTGEPATESIETESAPPTAKGERMVKHIKKGYANDGKLTDKEKSIAYATSWKQHNKEKNESINTGEDMRNLREGEIQQASAIVTAKTMVDRVGRWIEELSGMENDTLLTLGDSIRDEMGAEQAKQFISACAPAIQAALENLKSTREALSSSVRALTGEEQGAEMLGGEPAAGGDEFGADMEAPAEPDAMNAGGDEFGAAPEDDFSAAEPAAGGLETAGREKRESIDRSNQLLRVLAG
jgi:hypothetical protein